ncbi:MAG: HAD family hydrolase [Micromonosporaceae bacterium]
MAVVTSAPGTVPRAGTLDNVDLIASDLDGTLLRSDGTVSPRTLATLDAIDAAGSRFVMVTGRPIRWLPEVLDQTGVRGPVICANGGVVYDPESDTVLDHTPLLPHVVAEVMAALSHELPDVSFAVEVDHGRAMLSEVAYPSHPGDIGWRTVPRAALGAAPVAKLLARCVDAAPEEFLARCTKLLDGTVQVTSSSRAALVEISAIGVTKASGLAWYAERHGIDPSGVTAYGDMPNDVPMLSWAGRGVAMANAHPLALEVADEVTGSNDADGVAVHLESLFG